MNQYKVLAIVFSVLSFGSLQETFRIFTSTDPDITQNRNGLIPVAIIITGLFIFLAIRFWVKSGNSQKR